MNATRVGKRYATVEISSVAHPRLFPLPRGEEEGVGNCVTMMGS
jgi:hypothetical protein